MKFKAASRETVVKRLRKRIELQEESSKRVNMEAWRNALYKRSEYDELTGVLNRGASENIWFRHFLMQKLWRINLPF